MNPTLYDILGVRPDAGSDEIKAAWRDAAERFEPGSGGSAAQFRLFNEAAEVLLDPQRRAEYDEELSSRREQAPASREETPEPGEDTPEPREEEPATRSTEEPARARDEPAAPERPARRWWRVPTAALAVLALVTAVVAGLAIFLGTEYQRANAYEESLDQAPSAAERAATAVLAYDHKTLEADRDAAAKFLTPGYRDDYVSTVDKLVRENAKKTKAKVEAKVHASSAMLQGERDPDRVPVLLFVDQTTTSTANSGEPSRALNRVRFDMVKVDGSWLVDGITSY